MSIDRYFTDPHKLPSLIPDYLPRETQIRAADLIYQDFKKNRDIVLESPTGSGKTMAYLVPLFDMKVRALVSTKTKQLMQQLIKKDLPVMEKLFKGRKVASLKGRKNYFCPHRYGKWIYPNIGLYPHVIDWYEENIEAVSELPAGLFEPYILDKMSADTYQCVKRKCDHFALCPFHLAKEKANKADLIITNHHLVLADLAMRKDGSKIFETVKHLVFDEAHSLGDIFAKYAGVELSTRRLLSALENYRQEIAIETYHDLMSLAETLLERVPEKVYYDSVKKNFSEFFDLAKETAVKLSDEDLLTEFVAYEDDYIVLNSEEEGLRFAERKYKDVTVRFIPKNSGLEFHEGLTSLAGSSLMISATLTTGDGSFDYFNSQLGIDENKVTLAKMPPVFKLKNQAILYVPTVSERDTLDSDIARLVGAVAGSVLIICNSIARMDSLIRYLSKAQDKKVMSQNDGDWGDFTEAQNLVLVGCASLREGIDLAGGDFNCVIIDKLPFESPADMYMQYKMREAEEATGNAFLNFNLPRAVIYFKQAAGRLIRHERDLGVLAVFDNRLLNKSYGKNFLDVLDNVDVTSDIEDALNFLQGE